MGSTEEDVAELVRTGLTGGTLSASRRGDIEKFREVVWDAGKALDRPMPWRENTEPYWILVSEVMLQQTQVPRVLEKFGPFVNRFPGFADLARADLHEVMRLWSGLGYNRRARFLHESARAVQSQYNGRLPDDPAVLVTLPGIGPNTAGSIAAFAYDRRVVFIETNIRRVFLTAFFGTTEGPVHDRDLIPLVEKTLPREDFRKWYWSLMDLGVYLVRTDGNANRRSAHYVRQKPFERSRRQLRGKILHLLSHGGATAAEALPEYTGFSEEEVTGTVEILEREGLVRRTGPDGAYLAIGD
jgi:A/G-specific adenine glycosylase